MERRHLMLDLRPMERPDIALSVRHPSTDDTEALAVLMLDAYEGTIDADGSETLDAARDEVRGYFSPERQPTPEHSFIALDGDVPVAAILVSRHEGLPFIGYVMTAAAHKGRGLATSLTQLALASLHAAGERHVHLWVTRGNTPAERIYDRLGFRDMDRSVFEAAGGMDRLRRLAEAWHARVMADEVVSHAFSRGFHPQHTVRLAAYWAEALGGPTAYSDAYGDETSVVRMHSGNGIHEEMDRRAIACFDQALTDAGLAADGRLRQTLHDYFAWATTTSMARYHASADDVPDGLRIPRWSWDGLVE